MKAVGPVDIGPARGAEHRGVSGRLAPKAVGGRITPIVGFRLDDRAADPVDQQGGADQGLSDLDDRMVEKAGRKHGCCVAIRVAGRLASS